MSPSEGHYLHLQITICLQPIQMNQISDCDITSKSHSDKIDKTPNFTKRF